MNRKYLKRTVRSVKLAMLDSFRMIVSTSGSLDRKVL